MAARPCLESPRPSSAQQLGSVQLGRDDQGAGSIARRVGPQTGVTEPAAKLECSFDAGMLLARGDDHGLAQFSPQLHAPLPGPI